TGTRMLVWGGSGANTGGSYDPATNSWTATSTAGAPSGRSNHTAVWTGSRMIVWGGEQPGSSNRFNTGASYDPTTDAWTSVTIIGAPAPRTLHTAVWTGTRMIVFGGYLARNDGAQYDPTTDSW